MAPAVGEGMHVLVVEDEATALRVYERVLEQDGFETTSATTLQEAYVACEKARFDIALVDKNLPDGNGLALAKRLHESRQDCAVIIITGYGDLESAIQAVQLQVVDYILKPAELEDLRARIRRVVAHLRLVRQHQELSVELNEKVAENELLQEQVIRDPLTGLYNHAYFQERLALEISRSMRCGHEIGLVFVDLDHFKDINDKQGHLAGDRVLKTLAILLQGQSPDVSFRLRDHDMAARYGGDEFVLILPETSKAGATMTAERLRSAVESRVRDSGENRVTVSLGVATFPVDGKDRNSIIHAADFALYAAKQAGRNRVAAYTPSLESSVQHPSRGDIPDITRQLALEKLLTARTLQFRYQPVVLTRSGEIFGFEARCQPRDGIFQSHDEVVAAAERCGKVYELGRVLRECAVASAGDLPGKGPLFLNLHPLEIHDPGLARRDSDLARWATCLVLEINKSREVGDQQRLRQAIDRLRGCGFQIGLDDLFPGYLGLNSMMHLEPNFVRLEMPVLRKAQTDDRSLRLMKHYLDYAEAENIRVIAHGVASEEDRALVSRLACPLMQGPHLTIAEAAPGAP